MSDASIAGNPTLDAMTDAYLEAAQWTTTDDQGRPVDSGPAYCEFSLAARQTALEQCEDFLEHVDALDIEWRERMSAEQFGHDFWLTRNRHGAGFWDRGLGSLGDRLTDAAHTFGSVDVYVSDDGELEFA